MAKLLVHPKKLRIPPKTRKALEADGYIIITEDEIGSVRVLESLPDFDLSSESSWAFAKLLELAIADTSYGGVKEKFSAAILQRLSGKVSTAVSKLK
jgi:hypothetical protein